MPQKSASGNSLRILADRLTDSQPAGQVTNCLQELLDEARKSVPTSQEKEEQRRSFAYGNTNIENSRITREMVDQETESLKKESADSSLRSE